MSSPWPRIALADVTKVVAMGPFGSSIKVETFTESGVPIISGAHLGGSRLKNGPFRFIAQEHADRLSKANAYAGDVIFTHAGTLGQVSMVPRNAPWERYVISQRQFLVRCDDEVLLPEFLTAFFTAPEGQHLLLANAGGSGVPSISQPVSYLRTVRVPVPPLDEQRRIAGVLGALDDLIEVNRGLIHDLDALFHLEWRRRFAVSVAEPHLQLSDICTTQYGYTDAATSDSTGPKFLRVADINKHNWVDWKSVPHCSPQARDGGKYVLRKGDLVVARMADPGKCARVESNVDAVFASYLVRLTPSDPDLGLFLYGFLKSAQYLDYSQGAMTGSVQKNMNAKVITAARLTLPQSTEVASFNAFGGPLRDAISSLLDEIAQLEATRDELLPLLMSGRVRVREDGVAA